MLSDASSSGARQRITILLCTWNGSEYLEAQLASYLDQDYSNWDLWVSDDSSQDDTAAILDRFEAAQAKQRRIWRSVGPKCGVAANYLSALCHPDFPPGPVALSDQDDVWHPTRLSRAMDHLSKCTGPALYGAQYRYVDADLRPLRRSAAPVCTPSFSNALVQNIVSGHTATLNADALDLVRRAGVPDSVPYHDWWLYQLISGAGGTVVIDPQEVLLYRQHSANVIGGHLGHRAATRRIVQVLSRNYGGWLAANRSALMACTPLLTPAARETLNIINSTTARAGPRRVHALTRARLRRTGRVGQTALMLAAFLGRV